MDDLRVGAAFRAVRIRRRWRQSDVAARAGLSRSLVSLVERGHLDRVSLSVLRRFGSVLDIRIDVVPRWRGGALDRMLAAGHSLLAEDVAASFARYDGWLLAPEVSFSIYGERGVIDLLAFRRVPGRWSSGTGLARVTGPRTQRLVYLVSRPPGGRRRTSDERVRLDRRDPGTG